MLQAVYSKACITFYKCPTSGKSSSQPPSKASGTVLAATGVDGSKCIETGWHRKEQPRRENILSTMMSSLGIDWTKEIRNTPSGRAFPYVDPLGPNGFIPTDEISSIYG